MQDSGGLQRCCFGAESRDFLDAPRRVAVGHTHFVLSLFQAEVRGFPGDSQIAASTSPGQWERHRRGSKLTVMGGCKNSPPWGKRKQGCPLVSPAS